MENLNKINELIDQINLPNIMDVFGTINDSYLDLIKNSKNNEEKEAYEKGLQEIKSIIDKSTTDLKEAIKKFNEKVND